MGNIISDAHLKEAAKLIKNKENNIKPHICRWSIQSISTKIQVTKIQETHK
jgi:hypothetical protein